MERTMSSLGWIGVQVQSNQWIIVKKQEEFVFPKMADLPKMADAQREGLMKFIWKLMLIIIWSLKLILQD